MAEYQRLAFACPLQASYIVDRVLERLVVEPAGLCMTEVYHVVTGVNALRGNKTKVWDRGMNPPLAIKRRRNAA